MPQLEIIAWLVVHWYVLPLVFVLIVAAIATHKRKPKECDHFFRGLNMQNRDENGIVRWQCSRCGEIFEAGCGLDILKHGKCDDIWTKGADHAS